MAPTDAGERLLRTLRPALDDIAAELSALGDLRATPAGTIRINASEHAARTVVWPALARMLPLYPDIKVELHADNAIADIVADRFDAGVRLGEQVAKDMVAVRIGPDLQLVVVGSPAYLASHEPPVVPQDLAQHRCINRRLDSAGGLYAWEMEKDGRELRVRVDGQLIFNTGALVLEAACAGFGLAYVMADQAAEALADGRLVQVLADWTPPFPGYHLYYTSRRQHSAAFALLVEHLRYRD